MNKIKYNFWNSLLSMMVAYVTWVLFISGSPLVSNGNYDLRDWIEMSLKQSPLLSIPPTLSLLFIPLIIWSFNKLFNSPKFFPLWTAFSASFLVFIFLVSFYLLVSAGDSETVNLILIVKASLSLSLRFYSGGVSTGGLAFGITYLFLDRKFFSKEEQKL